MYTRSLAQWIKAVLHFAGKYLVVIVYVFLCYTCKPPDSESKEQHQATEQTEVLGVEKHPEALEKILEAHGGLDRWRKMQRLSFEMVKEGGNEKHYIQLVDRRDRVEGPNFTMGFDGREVWIEADTAYKGNPEFYHNLMFYFYAMPFVLADDGINYADVQTLDFEGVAYPGIRISYNEGVGTSPEDEYFLYYHPETYEMAWLGYTVTYFSGEQSEDIHWIRYSDWNEFSGLKLPRILTWYDYENALPTKVRADREFVNVNVGEVPFPDELFTGP
jgi:hypothetical protein